MFCFQCQETAKNSGCTIAGVCGKQGRIADLQDILIYNLKGLSEIIVKGGGIAKAEKNIGNLFTESLFMTITNANFDGDAFKKKIIEVCEKKESVAAALSVSMSDLSAAASWKPANENDLDVPLAEASVLVCTDENIRSLREMIIYGLKGISAYTHHAAMLNFENDEIYEFIVQTLATLLVESSVDALVTLTLKTGECAVKAMELLDRANTRRFGNPEITNVKTGVRNNPAILVSGHDLRDLQELLEQTRDSGVDVYTHSEMLPAHYYPELKKYPQLAGNYGSAWWKQNEEFASFNGAILMTTNCIIPVKEPYKNRIFTTGAVGYEGVPHIADRVNDQPKDFSAVIACAKKLPAPTMIDDMTIVGGFAHHQVLALADKVVAAVKDGSIKKFVVMAGCDGRHKSREYFTELAKSLPKDTIILTAGCAKYRYIKLGLGDIGGIPRVLDAGQCNDSYSLAKIALALKDVFNAASVNDLPIDFAIAWYEQKAVAVLLALLFLGFKSIRLGPTLPGFISPAVADVLVKNFDIKVTSDLASDLAAIVG